MDKKISVIIPSFHSKELTSICVRSLIRFCPSDIELQYIIIENSDDVSYKNDIVNLDSKIAWINNITRATGSEANAEAIDLGLKYVKHGLVFMCHCDTCVTSKHFLESMVSKYNDGHRLVGTLLDTNKNRIGAIHILGVLTDFELARKVGYMPVYKNGIQIMDVGNELTKYCRDNKIKMYCFRNTFNYPELSDFISSPYNNFRVVRCVGDKNEVIFMHLGRGVSKMIGTYMGSGKIGFNKWLEFCEQILI